MLAHVESASFAAPRLTDLRSRLATGRGAARELARLGGVVRLAEARYSPMGHAVLQILGLWDLHVLAALERWQIDSGAHARDWLAALGDAEALSALATLAYDNPDWTMPEIVDGSARVEARALGHPLLPASSRVNNDVTVGPPGTFLLVTGSNMSGKSTLLRAIGTNVVLARAGGPVCAESLRLTPVDMWTSIRIDDSLEAGVSLFMAELRRLKRIVDAARDPARPRPLLYLLDEILHGTNTAERRVAARRVLTSLIKAEAIGAATTHDLTLADDPALDAAAERVHFTERFERRDGAMAMTFDYRLRPGLATSANALKLLEMIGLGDGTG
jgi:DNA mismatch repair ATPase MutS